MSTFQVRDEATQGIWTIDFRNNTRSMTDPATGRLVTMDLGNSDVHIDSALATYAAGYQQAAEGRIADQVCEVLPVDKNSDKFFTWDKNDVIQDVQSLEVSPGGAMAEVSTRLSNASYNCISYGVQSAVATELQANADAPLNPERQALIRCINAINLSRERRVAALLTTSGNWTGGYTAAATAKWNGGAGSDPIKDLMAAIEASLIDPSAIVMSGQVYHDFIQNASVQKYIASKTNLPPLPGAEAFSAILDLPKIIVGKMKGIVTSTTYGYVWGSNVALIVNTPGIPSGGTSIATARTFRWNGANGGVTDGTMQGGYLVRSYFDPKRGPRGSKIVAVVMNDAEVMTSTVVGGLITAAHA